jgi:hypothetical protein
MARIALSVAGEIDGQWQDDQRDHHQTAAAGLSVLGQQSYGDVGVLAVVQIR